MTERKRRVTHSVEEIIAFVRERGEATEREVCEGLDMSFSPARRILEAAVFRKELVMTDYDSEGNGPLLRADWRYCYAE